MFTGIILAIGEITDIISSNDDKCFIIDVGDMEKSSLSVGDSICINGTCLTVIEIVERSIKVDVSTETLSCTNFNEYEVGSRVNLEKSLLPTERLNGHIVSGHVDGIGQIVSIKTEARSTCYVIEFPADIAKYLCKKGSVCVDGVSLTINDVSNSFISVNIIPHTMSQTIFSDYSPGSHVNIEIDIIARYLERLCKVKP